MLQKKTQVAKPRQGWFTPVAAVASVALLIAIAGAGPAVSTPSTTASNVTTAGATTPMALPAYFVGVTDDTDRNFGLYREFVRTAVPAKATPAQKATVAVAVAMRDRQFTNVAFYVPPWFETSVRKVTVTPRLIAVTLSGPGSEGFTPEPTRLAVQALVWTAQAAVGAGRSQ